MTNNGPGTTARRGYIPYALILQQAAVWLRRIDRTFPSWPGSSAETLTERDRSPPCHGRSLGPSLWPAQGQACAGHPRLAVLEGAKSWLAGPGPAMTQGQRPRPPPRSVSACAGKPGHDDMGAADQPSRKGTSPPACKGRPNLPARDVPTCLRPAVAMVLPALRNDQPPGRRLVSFTRG